MLRKITKNKSDTKKNQSAKQKYAEKSKHNDKKLVYAPGEENSGDEIDSQILKSLYYDKRKRYVIVDEQPREAVQGNNYRKRKSDANILAAMEIQEDIYHSKNQKLLFWQKNSGVKNKKPTNKKCRKQYEAITPKKLSDEVVFKTPEKNQFFLQCTNTVSLGPQELARATLPIQADQLNNDNLNEDQPDELNSYIKELYQYI